MPVSQSGVLSSEFDKVCVQFQEKEKADMHLCSYFWCNFHWSQSSAWYVHNSMKSQLYIYLRTLGTAFVGYRVHRGLYTILKKNQLYTYKAFKSPLFAFPCTICGSVHNSRKKQLYTYKSRLSVFTIVILNTILGKTTYTPTYLMREGLHVFT